VNLAHGDITFLDTPGHEAFTAMRARGARITDIVVLVVAADDGVMPQTQEAIDHARAAGVSIIVAINKIDKPQANLERVKKQLSELGLAAEDWGGKVITVPVSAKTGQGIDDLLEMILLEAQMLELKANPKRLARGVVVEAKMSKGRGPVATLLVQNGTLHLNENIIVGNFYGKIRAMFNDRGQSVTLAGPSMPVEVLGISGIPEAGEQFFAIADEKQAKELAQMRLEKDKQQQMRAVKRISLEDLHAQIEEGKIKELKLIIKADVQGSLEAIKETLNKLNVTEIKLDIIHTGVGNINSSDAILAVASNALILGFNVTMDELAKEIVAKEGIDVRTYNIIYELANDIKAAVEGMLEPKIKKVFLGRADVRKVFRLSRAGTVAGCFITKGKINRTSNIALLRNGQVVFEGKLASLKRFKDDVRDVAEGFECGIALSGFDAVQEGDIIEAFEIEKIARKL
jgi:translation initiation factor IF-2